MSNNKYLIKSDYLILKIADLRIKIDFHVNPKFLYLKKKIKNEIIRSYKNFLDNNYSLYKKYDFLINFKDELIYPLKINNNLFYLSFFKLCKNKKKVFCPYYISIFQFQALLILIIQNLLPKRKGFIIHSSGVIFNKKAFLFIGPENAGKTTIINLLKNNYYVLGDDSLIIRKIKNKFYCFQLPFYEKNRFKIIRKPYKYEIGELFFIKKANSVKIKKILKKREVIKKIIKQISKSSLKTKSSLKNIMDFIHCFNDFNILYFNKNKKDLILSLKNFKS